MKKELYPRTVSVCILALALVWPTAANAGVPEKSALAASSTLLSSWTSGIVRSLPVGRPNIESANSLLAPNQAASESSGSWETASLAAEESLLALEGPADVSPEVLPTVPLTNHSGVMYLTSTGNVHIDGVVYNPYQTAFRFVSVTYQLVDQYDSVVDEALGYASTWRLGPGESKSFKHGFYRPGAASENLHAHVSITGVPESTPPPVMLTPVSETVVDLGGMRAYTCVFRNDSAYTVECPTVGGWELDPSGALVDTLFGFESVQILPGATWTAEFTGFQSGVPVASRYYYCEAPVVEGPLTTVSIAGDSRIDTAIEASKKAFPADSADTVLIATAFNWPDALGGASLAGATNGPILLTDPNVLLLTVASEIDRLGAGKAYILGGTAAVGTGVENALKARLGSANVTRLGGSSRYETARLIAAETVKVLKAGPGYDGAALIATGANFPDALGASPLAAAMGWPLYLVDPRGVDSELISAMKSAGVLRVFPLGGTSVVSLKTESDLASQVPCTTQRLAGGNRYDTARVIATYGVSLGLTWDKVAIATGANFPDALAGGVLQGRSNSVMLLTPTASLDPGVNTALTANKALIREVRFLGGTSAVSTSVRTAVQNALK